MEQPPFSRREQPRIFPVASFELQGQRPSQQDFNGSVSFEKDGKPCLAVAVADGHGPVGAFAARQAVTTILERLKKHGDADEDLGESFAIAHELIVNEGVYGGTTLTAVIIDGGLLKIAWVGNCQARVFSADDATLHTLTLPHEYGAHPGETDRLMKQHALIVDPRRPYARTNKRGHIAIPGGSYIEVSRALGDPETEPLVLHEPEIKTVVSTADERYLIVASDGFWHVIERQGRRKSVERILADAKNMQDANSRLKSLVSKWNPDDNTTVVIVKMDDVAYAKP